MPIHGKGWYPGEPSMEPMRTEIDVLDRENDETIAFPSVQEALAALSTYWLTPGGTRPLETDEALVTINERVRKSACTVKRVHGRWTVYGAHAGSAKYSRRLLLVETDPVIDTSDINPYDDPALLRIASIPRSRRRVAHIYECAVCGRLGIIRGKKLGKEADKIAVRRDWHNTTGRGWVCPHHFRGRRTFRS